jgi:hypothetical protein
MKAYIGPYTTWWGPYQIAGLLKHVGASEDRCDKIGEWLGNTWVNNLCQWIESKRKRTVRIRIDRYDTWSMDATLSMLALPMLRQLHETKHGAPFTDDEDVPEGQNLRSTEAPPKEQEWDTDGNHFRRWDWIMDEMIWTFEQLQPDCDWEQQYYSGEPDFHFKPVEGSNCTEMIRGPKDTFKVDHEGLKAHNDRIANGLRLFGKYYRSLWD